MRDRPSRTAEAVCLFRAREQLRPEPARILTDPYAQVFLSPTGRLGLRAAAAAAPLADAADRLSSGLETVALARHALLDRWLLAALDEEPAATQVVILGAGYDTRAWRHAQALAGRPIFEVDHPATARRKARLVAEHGGDWPVTNRHVVEVDFEVEDFTEALLRAGFDPSLRTLWTCEGVTMYLRRAAVIRTLSAISAHSAAGSRLGLDWWFLLDDPDLRATMMRVSAGLLSLLGEHITFGLHPDDAPDFLGRRGFRVRERMDAGALQRHVVPDGRPVYPALWVCLAEVDPTLPDRWSP